MCLIYATGEKGSIVVCVSPLISLMMDQKKKFIEMGLSTDFVGESQSDRHVVKAVTDGSIQLVFISPESLLNNLTFRNMLLSTVYKDNLVALAIDEAHCIKTWLDICACIM